MKKSYFKNSQKFPIREIRKIPYENQFLLLGKLYRKLFLLYNLITRVTLHAEFGLIWTTPWPDENDFFLKFSKIRNSRNLQNSVWEPNFFPASSTIFFALHFHYIGDTPYCAWFDLDNSLPDKKELFLKFLFREKQKFPYEILNFFRTRYTIFFALHYHYTGDTP